MTGEGALGCSWVVSPFPSQGYLWPSWLSHSVSWEHGLATAGLAPTISLCRNVGGSPFLPGILATVSNVREVANVFLLGVDLGEWGSIFAPCPYGVAHYCWEYLLPVWGWNLTRYSKGFLFYLSSFLRSSMVRPWPKWKLIFSAWQEICPRLSP